MLADLFFSQADKLFTLKINYDLKLLSGDKNEHERPMGGGAKRKEGTLSVHLRRVSGRQRGQLSACDGLTEPD